MTFQDDVFDNDESEQNKNENDILFQDDILVTNEIDDIVNAEEEDYELRQVKSHKSDSEILLLEIEIDSGKTFEVPFAMIKKDRPIETARYISREVVEKTRGGKYETWAKKILRRTQRVIRRMRNYHNIDRIQRLGKIKIIKFRRVSKNIRDVKKKKREKLEYKSLEMYVTHCYSMQRTKINYGQKLSQKR